MKTLEDKFIDKLAGRTVVDVDLLQPLENLETIILALREKSHANPSKAEKALITEYQTELDKKLDYIKEMMIESVSKEDCASEEDYNLLIGVIFDKHLTIDKLRNKLDFKLLITPK